MTLSQNDRRNVGEEEEKVKKNKVLSGRNEKLQ